MSPRLLLPDSSCVWKYPYPHNDYESETHRLEEKVIRERAKKLAIMILMYFYVILLFNHLASIVACRHLGLFISQSNVCQNLGQGNLYTKYYGNLFIMKVKLIGNVVNRRTNGPVNSKLIWFTETDCISTCALPNPRGSTTTSTVFWSRSNIYKCYNYIAKTI